VGRAVDHSEGEAAQRVWRRWRWSLRHTAPPPLVSDGWGGHQDALLQVFGVSQPGRRQRAAGPGWHYLQVIKVRDAYRRVVALRPRLIWGKAKQAQHPLSPQTAYVERTHLTTRRMNARLARRSLCVSKSLSMLWASLYWCDALYNLVRPLKSLRLVSSQPGRCWTPRSPAMAAQLTDHLWSVDELLHTLPILTNTS
jgi:IS1 family transposase